MPEADYYDVPALWEAGRYLESSSELRRFARCVEMVPADVASVLDVGAGNGAFLRTLAEHRPGLALQGVERSETAIAAAVCAAPLRRGEAQALPYADRSFDLVTSLEMIEHLPFGVYETALREMERVARRYILITVPFREPAHQVECPYCGCSFHPFYHMRRYGREEMEGLFTAFGPRRVEKIRAPGEYALLGALRRVYGKLVSPVAIFPPIALCPQCGFGRRHLEEGAAAGPVADAPAVGQEPLKGAWRAVRRVLPRRMRDRWIGVLYARREPAAS